MNHSILRVMRDIAEVHRDRQFHEDIPLFADLLADDTNVTNNNNNNNNPLSEPPSNAAFKNAGANSTLDAGIRVSAVTLGPPDTPYANCMFAFLFLVGPKYPNDPPSLRFLSTDSDRCRLNPNLYQNGKVCLSVLGTWRGNSTETWRGSFGLAYVLRSVQAAVLTPSPFHNEPGFEEPPPSAADNAQSTASTGPLSAKELQLQKQRKYMELMRPLYNQKVRHEALRIGICQTMEAILGIFDPLSESTHQQNHSAASTAVASAVAVAATPSSVAEPVLGDDPFVDAPLDVDDELADYDVSMSSQADGMTPAMEGTSTPFYATGTGGAAGMTGEFSTAATPVTLFPHTSSTDALQLLSPSVLPSDSSSSTAAASPKQQTSSNNKTPPKALSPQSTAAGSTSSQPKSTAAAAPVPPAPITTTTVLPQSSLGDMLKNLNFSDRASRYFQRTATQFREELVPLFCAFYDTYVAEVEAYVALLSTTSPTTSSTPPAPSSVSPSLPPHAAVFYPPTTKNFAQMMFEHANNQLSGSFDYAQILRRLQRIWEQLENESTKQWAQLGEQLTKQPSMEALSFASECVDDLAPLPLPEVGLQVMVSGSPVDKAQNAFLWDFAVAVMPSMSDAACGCGDGEHKAEGTTSETQKQWLRCLEGCLYTFRVSFHPTNTTAAPRVQCIEPIGHPQISPTNRVPLLSCYRATQRSKSNNNTNGKMSSSSMGTGATGRGGQYEGKQGSTPLSVALELQQLFGKGPLASPVTWVDPEAGRALYGRDAQVKKEYLRRVRRMAQATTGA